MGYWCELMKQAYVIASFAVIAILLCGVFVPFTPTAVRGSGSKIQHLIFIVGGFIRLIIISVLILVPTKISLHSKIPIYATRQA